MDGLQAGNAGVGGIGEDAEEKYRALAYDTALSTLVAVALYVVVKVSLDGFRQWRARISVLIVGSGPVGLTAALVAVRSGKVLKLTVLDERYRTALLCRPQQIALDPRSVKFLLGLGVDFDNMEGCWHNEHFFTRIGVFQEYLLSILEQKKQRVDVKVQLGTKFTEEYLQRIPHSNWPRVIVVADGSCGDSCSVLGISSDYTVESCHAYGANATIERLDQRQVPTPEIRAHSLYFDLSAYGVEALRENRNQTVKPGFHLKIYGTFRNRYMALVCPASDTKMVRFLRHTANSSIMKNIFHQSFNAYKTDIEPRLSDVTLHHMQCSRRLFEIQLSHRRVSAAYIEGDNVAVIVEGEAARVLNFDTGFGVNLGMRGLESVGTFIYRAATAVDQNDILEALSAKMQHSRQAERSSCDVNILSIPVPIRRGGSESNLDVVDNGVGLDFTKGALGIDSLQQKILKVTEQIKVEQAARDQNVAEYLKLVNNADKQQVSRIRQVFEKKNQKSAHSITRLQKKLEQYHRRMKDSETNGKHSHKDGSGKESGTHSKEGSLRDVSSTGRHPALDKVKTIGPGVSLSPPFFFNKSREFANLIRNKFGSADNIAHLKSSMEAGSGLQVEGGARGLSGSATTVAKGTKYQSDDECSTGTSASADSNGNPAGGSAAGSGGPGRSDSNGRLVEVLDMVREIREAQQQLAEDMETLNTQFKRDYSYFTQVMQEERYRYEQLEDQLNDLTELHQHETSNLKQELASIEEKVAYQAYERARDIQEILESCQTRVSKLELQQQQQQQTVQLENTDAKVLLGKCINIMLAIVTVILVCVSTAAKFTAPLLRSRFHLALTCVGVSVLALLWKNWEHLQYVLERMLLPH